MILFIFQELHTAEPVVDLRVLNNRTFAVGTVFTTIVMFAMYGTYVLIPLYCQQIVGYTPLIAGFVLSIQSFGTLASIMLAGRLFNYVDARIMVALGCLIGGYGSWGMAHFNSDIDFWNIALPGLYRGIGSGLIFIPMTTMSLSAVSKEEMGNGVGPVQHGADHRRQYRNRNPGRDGKQPFADASNLLDRSRSIRSASASGATRFPQPPHK